MILAHYQQFVDHTAALVRSDPRFAGLAVGGSWKDGRLDEWSDLDLIFVTYEQHQEQLLGERRAIADRLGDVLVAYAGDQQHEPRLMICLYDSPLMHVGLKFFTLGDFEERVENPTVIFERDGGLSAILAQTTGAYPIPDLQDVEDHFWIWVHYAALRLGRGELLELADHLAYIRNQALGSLLLMQYGKEPRRVRRAEQDLPPQAFEKLRATVGAYDRQALIEAIWATVELYLELREYHRTPALISHERAQERVLAFLQAVQNRPVV